jgi:hypothetical protein
MTAKRLAVLLLPVFLIAAFIGFLDQDGLTWWHIAALAISMGVVGAVVEYVWNDHD